MEGKIGMRILASSVFCALIVAGTSACGTRLASPYDSISDEMLTQTYLTLIRVKHRTAERPERCMDSAQKRDFERVAINFEVLIARYRARPVVGDTVVKLRKMKAMVTPQSTKVQGGGLCSPDFWKEIERGFETVWIVEQSKRSSRNEFFEMLFGFSRPQNESQDTSQSE